MTNHSFKHANALSGQDTYSHFTRNSRVESYFHFRCKLHSHWMVTLRNIDSTDTALEQGYFRFCLTNQIEVLPTEVLRMRIS